MTKKKISKEAKRQKQNLAIIYALGLIVAISTALPSYIQSNYLNQFVGLKTVSLFFIVANIFGAASILFFPNVIKRFSNYLSGRWLFALYVFSLYGLSAAWSPLSALAFIALYSVSNNLLWISFDIIIERFSCNATTGQTRTIYFTFMNLGWIIAPSLSYWLVAKGGYSLSFLVSVAFAIPCLAAFFALRRRFQDDTKKYQKESPIRSLKKTWQDKNLRSSFIIATLLQLFYSSAVIYVPIYLVQNLGMSWTSIGPIFSFMLIPFLLIEIPAGKIADRYLGEKEMMFIGVLILSLALFLFFSIDKPVVWVWASVLFFSRVGAALVESMKESYFFKLVDASDVGLINIFRLTTPLAYVINSAIAIIILDYFPVNYIFLAMGLIMTSGLLAVLAIKDSR